MVDLSDKKLELSYPTNWQYKIIVKNHSDILVALEEILDKREHKLSKSKSSKGGKFISYNLELLVHNDDDRVGIYNALQEHNNLKYIL